MEAKAFQCMQNGMNVIFVLPFTPRYNEKTLLTLKMEQQWQNLKEKHQWDNEFKVCSVKIIDNHKIDFDHFKELVQGLLIQKINIL